MPKGPQDQKLVPPPKWLMWAFLIVFIVAAICLSFGFGNVQLGWLVAASLVYLLWIVYGKGT